MKRVLFFLGCCYLSCAVKFRCPQTSDEILMLGHPADCRKYVVCVEGKALPQTCPDESAFNNRLQACDFSADKQLCWKNSVNKTKYDGEMSVMVCPQKETGGSSAVHFPHDYDCGRFYVCNHGQPLLRDCPAGLHFNAKKNVCDFPFDAGCTLAADNGEA